MIDRQLNYGREIVVRYAREELNSKSRARVLDIGAGHGADLQNVRKDLDGICQLDLWGIEKYEPNQILLSENNIKVLNINIERDRFPIDDSSIDLVCANQVLEHCKDIFWILSEISRCLRPGGV